MILYPRGETVDVYRPTGAAGRYGDNIWTYPGSPTGTVDNIAIDPGGTSEENDGRTAVITTPKLYRPGSAPDLLPHDQIVSRAGRFEVIGDVQVWISPFSDIADGAVVDLRRVEG